MRTTFNQDRFEDCPPEVIFGEVFLMEVNDFISILYAALVRFYLPAVSLEDLELLTQDLIEIATSVTIDGSLSNWLLKLCRLTLAEEEQLLKVQLAEYRDLEPEQIGVHSMFTMN